MVKSVHWPHQSARKLPFATTKKTTTWTSFCNSAISACFRALRVFWWHFFLPQKKRFPRRTTPRLKTRDSVFPKMPGLPSLKLTAKAPENKGIPGKGDSELGNPSIFRVQLAVKLTGRVQKSPFPIRTKKTKKQRPNSRRKRYEIQRVRFLEPFAVKPTGRVGPKFPHPILKTPTDERFESTNQAKAKPRPNAFERYLCHRSSPSFRADA